MVLRVRARCYRLGKKEAALLLWTAVVEAEGPDRSASSPWEAQVVLQDLRQGKKITGSLHAAAFKFLGALGACEAPSVLHFGTSGALPGTGVFRTPMDSSAGARRGRTSNVGASVFFPST